MTRKDAQRFTLPPVGGEGRPRERSERGRGGEPTLVPCVWLPPTPNPSPPLASLAGGGELQRIRTARERTA
jgi:hypothetical protein